MRTGALSLKNLARRPGRTAALILLTGFLALSVLGGSLVISSLRRGLASLEDRLGADIILLPSSAQSKISFEKLFLQGTTGAFYMDASVLDEALAAQGVAAAAPQTFLASLKADCCSVKIQVIGFDPEKDFTVRPWIGESYAQSIGKMEVAVGCNVEAGVGEIIRIYDERCKVIARLAPTGTGLDTAVYCTMDTMDALLRAAENKGISHKITSGDESRISAVYVKAREGADIDQLNSYLNSHIRKATAVRTRSMITQVSDSLAGVTRTVRVLIAAVWALAVIILLIVFAMMTAERRREFAVLRLIGMSRRALSGMLLLESLLSSACGALAGAALAVALALPFTALIENSLGLPYLTPDASAILTYALGAVLLTVLVGAVSSAWAAWKLSRTDPGTALREGS